MSAYILPVAFALFVWWFSTGLVLLLDRAPRRTHFYSLMVTSGLALTALTVLWLMAGETTVVAAYVAFLAAIVVWGWHELAFLLGIVTGPRRLPCPPDASTGTRFWLAVQALAYHEIAMFLTLILIWIISYGEPNQVGFWTFAVLFGMRLSAKLNIFLGVPYINEEFLPKHLDFLKSYFARKSMNWLFPFSVTASMLIGAYVFHLAFAATNTGFETAAYMLTASFLMLGTLEHWLMITRLPDSALWRWAMREQKEESTDDRSVNSLRHVD